MNRLRFAGLKLAVGLIALVPFWLGASAASSMAPSEGLRLSAAMATPTPSPTMTATTTPNTSPTLTATATPTTSPTMTATATPTTSPTITATATATTSPTMTATATPTTSPTVTATATLTPTLSPVEAFNAHFPVQLGSKLSLHFVRGSPATYDLLRTAHPPFVKLVDAALDWSTSLRREFPDMMQIGRVTGVEDDSLTWKNPIVAANDFVAKTLPYYRKYPDIDYWEGWNEWTAANANIPGAWQAYALFEAERACMLQRYGYHAVIGNFAAGRPEYQEMLVFLPAIRIGLKCGAILGLHEYSAPTLQYGYGQGIPHRPTYPDRGILTLRYRYWYQDMFIPLDLPIPLVITEFGIDGGVDAGRPGPRGISGWLDFGKYWKDTGLGDNAAQVYISQLAWYDSEIRKDPYVLGAALYQAGSYGSNPFEVEKLIPELTNYLVGMRGK